MMKYLPALLCAAGLVSACAPATPALTPAQESVSAHLKKTLDDPASYAPVRWGKEVAITRADSASIVALAYFDSKDEAQQDAGLALIELAKKDTLATAGTALVHAFRAKNKLGAVVLDSARFVVGKGGAVTVLP